VHGTVEHPAGAEWNIDSTVTVHQLVAAQVAAFPQRVAVADSVREWTYQQVSAEADTLAAALDPVGPGDRVGIHIGRRGEAAVALLAVLRRGAAYVPLDPDYPAERLRYMVDDAALRVVITDDEAAARAFGVDLVMADAARRGGPAGNHLVAAAAGAPQPVATPESAAYVIYTSGSTRRPKGVVVAHRGVANVIQVSRATFGFGATDSVLALASFSFDFAALEMLLPLASGGTLHLADRSVARNPDALTAELARRRITYLMGTPSMFGSMLAAGWRVPEGITVIAGGEVLPAALVRQLGRARAVWNLYGPTETSIYCTVDRADRHDEVTIGAPIPNVVVRILDGDRPVAVGTTGEICVGGTAVALGYHERPQLTAERFVADPVSGTGLLYRSGDLGRWRADGRIDFLGRADDQVKVRGFRIELGEIDAVLREHPDVQEAAVVADRRDGAVTLTAHVVLHHGRSVSATPLRDYLLQRLPAHEVPHRITFSDELPRSANGKIDKRALVAASAGGAPVAGDADLAGDARPTADLLIDIWKNVLHVDAVETGDNFFDIGGDSLSALRLVGRVRAAGFRLSVATLYRHPTIQALLGALTVDGQTSECDNADGATTTGPFPLLPAQARFFERQLAEPSHYSEPLVLGVRQPLDRDILTGSLVGLAERHPGLRSRFVDIAGHRAVCLAGADEAVPLEWHDLRQVAAAEREPSYHAQVDRLNRAMDLTEGPVCRAAYFAMGDRDILYLLVHHLVCDGVALQTLVEELCMRYEDLGGDRSVEMLPAPLPAPAYAARLHTFANSGEAARIGAEWLALPWDEIAALPADNPAGSLAAEHVRTIDTTCSETVVAQLLTVSRQSPFSAEDVVLAALGDAVATVCGAPTVAIDVCRHGRQSPLLDVDVTRTVGWLALVAPYVLTVPTDAAAAGRLGALRQQIRRLQDIEQAWAAVRYLHDCPEVITRATALPRPQLFVNFRGAGMHDLPVSGRFRQLDTYVGQARLPSRSLPYPIELRIDIVDDRLVFRWRYSTDVFGRDQVRDLAEECRRSLGQFLAVIPDTRW
jgi:amino acid adenylation domain-containing protein